MRKDNPAKGLSTPMTQLLLAIRQFDFSHHSLQELKSRLVAARDNIAETYAILREIIRRFSGLLLFDYVVDWMQRCSISENGIDLEAEGLSGATTTWTYLINDSADQFNRIPFLIKTLSNSIRGTLFTVCGLHSKWKQWAVHRP